MAKVDVNYLVLRIIFPEDERDVLKMESEKGSIGNVVKPRLVEGKIKFKHIE